jgi:predicted ArsR family transcriptional regulator
VLARDTNHLKALGALVVVAVLLDSSLLVNAAVPQGHHGQGTQSNGASLTSQFTTPFGQLTFAGGEYLSANMTTRGEIMAYILTNPGVYMREVSEDLGLSIGVVQYHVWVLSKNGEIEECRSGRYRRFFGARRYGEVERTIISLMRQRTAGRILGVLSDTQPLPHMELANLLGITSQALTWHMKRLKSMCMVEGTVVQGQTRMSYRLAEAIAQKVQEFANPDTRITQAPLVR